MTLRLFQWAARYAIEHAAYWLIQSWNSLTHLSTLSVPASACRSVTVVFNRTEPAGVTENVAEYTLHFCRYDGANDVFIDWQAADYTAVETELDTLWNSLKTAFTPHWILAEYRWHRFGSDLPAGRSGAMMPGPLERLTTKNVAGTYGGTSYVPDQCALTVTFRTGSRKHWGRVYLPLGSGNNVDAYGRATTGWCDAVATAFRTALVNCDGGGRVPVVWSPHYFGALSIASIVVDNTPDVVRRRRAKHSTYWKTFTS